MKTNQLVQFAEHIEKVLKSHDQKIIDISVGQYKQTGIYELGIALENFNDENYYYFSASKTVDLYDQFENWVELTFKKSELF